MTPLTRKPTKPLRNASESTGTSRERKVRNSCLARTTVKILEFSRIYGLTASSKDYTPPKALLLGAAPLRYVCAPSSLGAGSSLTHQQSPCTQETPVHVAPDL